MITQMRQIDPDGTCEFRSYTLAFSPGARLVHKFGAGPLTATKAVPDVAKRDGRPFHSSEPRGDHLGDDNKPAYASLHAIINAAQCPDFGFAQDCVRDGSIPFDAKLRGVPCWRVGDSANRATAKLKSEYAQHLAKTSDIKNRKPASRSL